MIGGRTESRIRSLRLAGVCALGLGFAPALAFAQYAPPPPEQPKVIDLGSMTDPPPDLLDGTLSGLGDELDNENTEENGSSWLRFASPMQPWLDFKQNVLLQQYGLMIGGSEGNPRAGYSNSLTNDHGAVGQKFTLNAAQQLLWKGTPEALWIDMVVEDRGPVGTEFAPLQAGLRTGSSTATAPTWGEFNLGVTQLYLRQNLFDNHFQYTFGKIFAPNYVNPYPLFDDNRQYLNQIFTTSVTIPVPLRGFGAVAALFPTISGSTRKEESIPSIATTPASPLTIFQQARILSAPRTRLERHRGERRAHPGAWPDGRQQLFTDALGQGAEQNGPAAAHGVAFNANYLAQANLMLFGRGGWSEGWQLDRNLCFGVGWRPAAEYSDLLASAGAGRSPRIRS